MRPLVLAAVAVALTVCTGCGPVASQTSTLPSGSAAAPTTTPPPSVVQQAECAAARTTDSSGQAIPESYARAVQQILEAACQHDYSALTGLMDDRFTDDRHSSASPTTIVGSWRLRYPTATNLDLLAATLADAPVVDQGGVTYSHGGSTVTFARQYQSQPWSGFTVGDKKAAGTGGVADGSSGRASEAGQQSAEPPATCPGSATLVAAWNAGSGAPNGKASTVSGIRCSGRWAAGQVQVDDGSTYGNAYSGLFEQRGSGWTSVDREQPCASGQVPPSLRIVCDSN